MDHCSILLLLPVRRFVEGIVQLVQLVGQVSGGGPSLDKHVDYGPIGSLGRRRNGGMFFLIHGKGRSFVLRCLKIHSEVIYRIYFQVILYL